MRNIYTGFPSNFWHRIIAIISSKCNNDAEIPWLKTGIYLMSTLNVCGMQRIIFYRVLMAWRTQYQTRWHQPTHLAMQVGVSVSGIVCVKPLKRNKYDTSHSRWVYHCNSTSDRRHDHIWLAKHMLHCDWSGNDVTSFFDQSQRGMCLADQSGYRSMTPGSWQRPCIDLARCQM